MDSHAFGWPVDAYRYMEWLLVVTSYEAGKREVFGKVVVVSAMPARTMIKAFPVAALK